MALDYRSVLFAFALAGCVSRAPAKAAVRQPNADSAVAARAEHDVAGAPPADAPDTKQLKRAIHDLSVMIFNARVNHKDTADAPAWSGKLDAIANEMPAASDADPKYAAAYQHMNDAIQLARQFRLPEAYAYADTAFKKLR